ncbi:metaxin-1 [Galendromus occidentalis]|uniref:Metaxin-1 n=1 Tax=Galendromus occidentalis TaxID=34638 RepID=A0AAJ7PAR4_9ACAR|nr:metaxin-1 [Galendromus occidentalis]
MELSIWRGEWGLGSVSIECLEALVYSKIVQAVQKIHVRKYVFSSDMSPWLWVSSSGKSVVGASSIISYLKSENLDADCNLTQKERADILAYKNMIKYKIAPALKYAMWCDERNYCEVIRPTFAKIYTFPSNYSMPGRLQRAALLEAWGRFGECATPNEMETKLNRKARECMTALSERLGKSSYFFGSKPTSFDAYVFAYLSLIVKTPLPNASLNGHLNTFSNLVEFESRIHNRFVASEVRRRAAGRTRPEWVGVVLSLSFAASVMFSYAIVKGILHIDFKTE